MTDLTQPHVHKHVESTTTATTEQPVDDELIAEIDEYIKENTFKEIELESVYLLKKVLQRLGGER